MRGALPGRRVMARHHTGKMKTTCFGASREQGPAAGRSPSRAGAEHASARLAPPPRHNGAIAWSTKAHTHTLIHTRKRQTERRERPHPSKGKGRDAVLPRLPGLSSSALGSLSFSGSSPSRARARALSLPLSPSTRAASLADPASGGGGGGEAVLHAPLRGKGRHHARRHLPGASPPRLRQVLPWPPPWQGGP